MKDKIRAFAIRHPVVSTVIPWAAAIVLLLGISLLLGSPFPDSAAQILIFATFYWGLPLGWVVHQARKARRSVDQGVLFGHIRYPGSTPGSLADIWNPGEVTVTDGMFHFQARQDLYGVPVGKPVIRTVHAIDSIRRATFRQDRHLVLGTWPAIPKDVVTLHTDKGDIEFVGIPQTVELLIERLQPDRQES